VSVGVIGVARFDSVFEANIDDKRLRMSADDSRPSATRANEWPIIPPVILPTASGAFKRAPMIVDRWPFDARIRGSALSTTGAVASLYLATVSWWADIAISVYWPFVQVCS
jgi:hypothetical protein